MDPPPQPTSDQFRKPQGPARPRAAATGTAAAGDAGTSSASTSSQPLVSNDALVASMHAASLTATTTTTTITNTKKTTTTTVVAATSSSSSSSASQASQEVADSVTYYTKPVISASQIADIEPTQMAENDFTQLGEGFEDQAPVDPVVVYLKGHGSTTSASLTLAKRVWVFGTSDDCDRTIDHAHWATISSALIKTKGPWFKLHLRPGSTPSDPVTAFIEDVSRSGIYHKREEDKKLTKGVLTQLKWGDSIHADSGNRSLFRYTFQDMPRSPENDKVLDGYITSYKLLRDFVGDGMYSEVCKAKNMHNGKIFACKIIDRFNKNMNEQTRENVAFEIDILKSLNHRNIIKYQDVCQEEYSTYIIMEFVEGCTLYQHYGEVNNYFTEMEARQIFRQVCEAVEYLHVREIAHRDIKSENVMIRSQDHAVKLIDFGLARSASSQPILTAYCGTHAYMAPEIAYGDEKNGYGTAVDVWALGVMLFRMLAGEYPFEQDTHAAADQSPEAHAAKDQADTSRPTSTAPQTDLEPQKVMDESHDETHVDTHVKKETQSEHTPSQDLSFQREWQDRLTKMAPRSPEVHRLLVRMLEEDATKRIRIQHVLQEDWFRMREEDLQALDTSARQGSTEVLSNESDPFLQSTDGSWGLLEIMPGSLAGAPRRIELSQDKTWIGRDARRVDVSLGVFPYLSSVQCQIQREADGSVLVADASLNGTYINSMRIMAGRASQLLNGDVLGFLHAPDRAEASECPTAWVIRNLQYKVTIFGAPPIQRKDLVVRRYIEQELVLPPLPVSRVRKDAASLLTKDTRTGTKIVWGTLAPLNDQSKEEFLTEERTRIGRDLGSSECEVTVGSIYVSREHCVIEWSPLENKAWITNSSSNRTIINGSLFSGRFQLREDDEICVVNPSIVPGLERKKSRNTLPIGWTIHFQGQQNSPRSKRVKIESGTKAKSEPSVTTESSVKSESLTNVKGELSTSVQAETPAESSVAAGKRRQD